MTKQEKITFISSQAWAPSVAVLEKCDEEEVNELFHEFSNQADCEEEYDEWSGF